MIRFLLALLLLASPALAQSPFPSTVSEKSAAISITSATTTQLIPAISSESIGITAFNIIASGSGNIKLVYGTGTNCGTGQTDLTGNYPLAASSGISSGAGIGLVLIAPPGNAVCAVTSAAVTMAGSIAFVQF